MHFIDSARYMASSSNLVNNLSEGLHRFKCKFGNDNEKYETCLKNMKNLKDDLIEYKYLSCNKSYQKKLDEKLKERFFST